jgi:alpha-tubulin suppressor-like RCC1 family protein
MSRSRGTPLVLTVLASAALLTACERPQTTAPPDESAATPIPAPLPGVRSSAPTVLAPGSLSRPEPFGASASAPGMAVGAQVTLPASASHSPALAWENTSDGSRSIWQMNGTAWEGDYSELPTVSTEWRIVAAGDFTGNGSADLVWFNALHGMTSIWHMDGHAWTGDFSALPVVPTGWEVAAAGDFNGDGSPDLVWQNTGTGQRSVWFMQGTSWNGDFAELPHVPGAWRIAAAADFNGDGHTDLVWQNLETGQRSIWQMNGSTWTGNFSELPTIPAAWRIAGAGDFNGDGSPDLVWQNVETGERSIWLMDGMNWSGNFALLPQVPPTWHIATVLVAAAPPPPTPQVQPDLRNIVITQTGQNSHTCALRVDGTTLCWGDNTFGQLGSGDPNLPLSATPVAITGGHTFIGLSSGINHKCGITAAGAAWCWGNNVQGQLGAGTGPNQFAPVQVSGGHHFVDIDSDGNTTCTVTAAGDVYCWGNNISGQLGTGSTTDSHVPAKTSTTVKFAAVAVGGTSACALTPNGQPYCWGANNWGQLGDGAVGGTALTPQAVVTDLRFVAIQVYGSTACGLDSNGDMWCWGWDPRTQAALPSPDRMTGTPPFVAMGTGALPAGIRADGVVYGWNLDGAFVRAGGFPFAEFAIGGWGTCGITSDGAAFCFGRPYRGLLGNGEWEGTEWPVQVAASGTFRSVSVYNFGCALTTAGIAHCWGRNHVGQLGRGTTSTVELQPAPVAGDMVFDTIAVGGTHACALTPAGAAYCWGNNGSGQLGHTDGNQSTPAPVPGGHTFRSIHPGNVLTCALTTGDDVYCWGANTFGEFGTGSASSDALPVTAAAGGIKFSSLDVFVGHACGIGTDGVARCWGYNFRGQLGDGTNTNRHSPTAVAGGHSFKSIYASNVTPTVGYTCGLTQEGAAWCWGRNLLGQLGNGNVTDSNVPMQVHGGLTFELLSLGGATCGLRADGSTYCWGTNAAGQFGRGTLESSVPVPAAAATGLTLRALSVGPSVMCGVSTSGPVHCAGTRGGGILGDGSDVPLYSAPIPVLGGHTFRR